MLAAAEAEKERVLAAARADSVRAVGHAEAEAEAAKLAAYARTARRRCCGP